MSRLALLLASLGIVVGACASDATIVQTDPGSIVLWADDSIAVVDGDGDAATLEVLEGIDAAVSQVTPSPDGRLAWTTIDAAGQGFATTLGALDGTDRVDVEVPTTPFFYQWNDSATRLAFLGNDPAGAGVMFGTIDVDAGTAESHVIDTPFFLDWDPEGGRVVANVGGREVDYVAVPSGDIEQIPEEIGAFPAPAWTTRGVYFARRLAPSVAAGVRTAAFQAAESEVVLLDPATNAVASLATSPSGLRLFPDPVSPRVAIVDGPQGGQRLRVVGDEGALVETFQEGTFDIVQWSPNGISLLVVSRAPGELEADVRVWDGTEMVDLGSFLPSVEFASAYLPFWDQYDRALSLWAPDSSSFVLPGRNGVELISLTGDVTSFEGYSMGAFAPGSLDRSG